MARIRLGSIVTNISGSVGGSTFQRNNFGLVMRSKPNPLNISSESQSFQRARIAALQLAWQNLTPAQRSQWERFIAYSMATIRRDKSILINGQGLFIKYQLMRSLLNIPLLTDIIYTPMPDVTKILNLYTASGLFWIQFYDTVDCTKFFFILKLSKPRLESQVFSKRYLRFMNVMIWSYVAYDVTASYLDAFGSLPSDGSFIHYSIQWFSMLTPIYSTPVTGIIQTYAL